MTLKSVALYNRKHSKKAVSQTTSGYKSWGQDREKMCLKIHKAI